ncbi:MAG: methyltransferase [Pseudonocardia sp.]
MTAGTDERARLVELLFGFFPAQLIQTMAQLRVPDELADGPLPVEALAQRTGTHPPSLERLLRAGTGLGLVTLEVDGTYALAAAGKLLCSGAPGSISNLARIFCGDVVWRAWGELEYSVRTGEPSFEKVTGSSVFAHLAEDPEMLAVFTEAMAEGSRIAAPGVVASCDLDGRSALVDVGGGNGTLLAAFLAAHPRLRGVLFDTADGLGDAAQVLAASGVADRCEAVVGDFFEVVPAADAYVLKSVIHDWDDERSVEILTRVRQAMPPHAVVFVVEPVLPEDADGLGREPAMLMSDLNMLVCTGGRERTGPEFDALLAAAGLRLVSSIRVPPPTGFSVLRAVPA